MKLLARLDYNPGADQQEQIDLCDFAWRKLFINTDASVQVCCGDYNALLQLEDVSEVDDIWNCEILQDLRKSFFTKKNLPSFCKRCEWFKLMTNNVPEFGCCKKEDGLWDVGDNIDSVTLNITENCNLRCAMCGKWAFVGDRFAELDLELPFEIIERIVKKFGPHVGELNICANGEFMLHSRIDDILDLMREVQKDRGFRILTGNTNGLLLGGGKVRAEVLDVFRDLRFSIDTIDPKVYRGLRGVNPATGKCMEEPGFFRLLMGRVSALFGIQKTSRGRGDVDVVKSIIQSCVEYRDAHYDKQHPDDSCKIGVSCVVMKKTIPGLLDLFRWAVENGLDTFHCQNLVPVRQEFEDERADSDPKYMKSYDNAYYQIHDEKPGWMTVFMPLPFNERDGDNVPEVDYALATAFPPKIVL